MTSKKGVISSEARHELNTFVMTSPPTPTHLTPLHPLPLLPPPLLALYMFNYVLPTPPLTPPTPTPSPHPPPPPPLPTRTIYYQLYTT